MQSLIFETKKPSLKELRKSIIQHLPFLIPDKIEETNDLKQIFNHFSYKIDRWFLSTNPKVSAFNRKSTELLLESSMRKAKTLIELRFCGNQFLQKISHVASSIPYIERDEDKTILQRIDMAKQSSNNTIILLIGESGIGKSSFIYTFLAKRKNLQNKTLVLPAKKLFQSARFANLVVDVIKNSKEFQYVFIDGPECYSLLTDFSHNLKELFKAKGKIFIFSINTNIELKLIENTNVVRIRLHPLPLNKVLSTYPQLQMLKKVQALMDYATIPFYLKEIVNLLGSKRITIDDLANVDIKDQLINLIIEGKDPKNKEARKAAWKWLARKNSKQSTPISSGQNLPPGLKLLEKDKIIFINDDGEYEFQHQLYHNYAIMGYMCEQWLAANDSNTLATFWGTHFESAQWIITHYPQIKANFQDMLPIIRTQPYFPQLLPDAITEERLDFLYDLLQDEAVKRNLNKVHGKINGDYETTYVLIAIKANKPKSLTCLLENGAELSYPYPLSENISESDGEKNTDHENFSDADGGFCGYDYNSQDEANPWIYKDTPSPQYESDNDYQMQREKDISAFTHLPEKYWQSIDDEIPLEPEDELEVSYDPPELRDNRTLYLHQAVLNDSIECVSILLNHDTNSQLEKTNNYQETALHIAASESHYQLTEVLLNFNFPVNYEDRFGETPLHNASYVGDRALIALLLRNSANPNQMNKKGLTPFHIALTHLNIELVKLFFDYGADLSISPFDDDTIDDDNKLTVADLLDIIGENQYKNQKVEEFVIWRF